jgi:hypothetical protein
MGRISERDDSEVTAGGSETGCYGAGRGNRPVDVDDLAVTALGVVARLSLGFAVVIEHRARLAMPDT